MASGAPHQASDPDAPPGAAVRLRHGRHALGGPSMRHKRKRGPAGGRQGVDEQDRSPWRHRPRCSFARYGSLQASRWIVADVADDGACCCESALIVDERDSVAAGRIEIDARCGRSLGPLVAGTWHDQTMADDEPSFRQIYEDPPAVPAADLVRNVAAIVAPREEVTQVRLRTCVEVLDGVELSRRPQIAVLFRDQPEPSDRGFRALARVGPPARAVAPTRTRHGHVLVSCCATDLRAMRLHHVLAGLTGSNVAE